MDDYGNEKRFSTTKGFVYLTNDIFKAYEYGNNAAKLDGENSVWIFKLTMIDSILEIDLDDGDIHGTNISTIQESLDKLGSVRIKGDIIINESHKVMHAELPAKMYKVCKMARVLQRTRNESPTPYQKGYIKGGKDVLDAFLKWK